MTGGQALVKSLKKHGVDTIFGLPGVQLDHTFDALYHEQDSIQVIHTRHEQATAYMAFGYAMSTGKVGVNLVVPGPGLLNATAALSTAYATNTPVLCLTGQIQSDHIERGYGDLHEIPNQLGMIRSVTKWAARIDSPAEAPEMVNEAFFQLKTGRPRPVELEMAPDIMGKLEDVDLLDPPDTYSMPGPDSALIEEAAKILGKAKKPIIFCGSGVLGAEEELFQLAETLQAPVVMSAGARGVISDRSYLAQSMLSAEQLVPEADALLAVGTRLARAQMALGKMQGVPQVRIEIDPEEIHRISKAEVSILADAKKSLAALLPRVEAQSNARPSRKDELVAAQEYAKDILFELQPQATFAQVMRDNVADDGFIVSEVTQLGYFSNMGMPVYQPRTFIQSGYQGTLGFGFSTALGVQVANPDKQVLSFNGDGGFMYNMQELSTAVRHNIPIVAIVYNDNRFGNVYRIQQESYDGRVLGSNLHNPDFVRLAESFGAAGLKAESPEDLDKAIKEGFDNKHPTLIEVPVGEMPSIWPLIFRNR